MDRNFGVGRDIKRERKLEWEASESLDRDLLSQRVASLERDRLQVRLLPLEPESEFESEGEEALSDSKSESELDDLYEARTCQNFACSSRIYTGPAHLECFLLPNRQSSPFLLRS